MVRDSGKQRPVAKGDRIPPYSEEAEKGVLGAILLDSDRALNLAIDNRITPETFYTPAHRTIYEAMVSMLSSGQAVDVLTLADFLRAGDKIKSIGGDTYLDRSVLRSSGRF